MRHVCDGGYVYHRWPIAESEARGSKPEAPAAHVRERGEERERETDRQTDRDRERERQRERETERERESERASERERARELFIERGDM